MATVHIGERIKKVIKDKGLSARWLAEQIPCERSNIYSLFKRESIGVDLLFIISTKLDHDFFKELSYEWSTRNIPMGNVGRDFASAPVHKEI